MANGKPIVGYEGLYSITEDGMVYSHPREMNSTISSTGKTLKKGKWLKGGLSHKGYKTYALTKDNKSRTLQAHRLVAMTYIPNPDNKEQVNHIDGNKLNNHYSNLEWNTPLENVQHAWATGLCRNELYQGSNNGSAKLTEAQVLAIRSDPRPSRAVASAFGVSKTNILDIRRRKIWKHI